MDRVQFSSFLMGSRQRAKGDMPEPFQLPTLLRAACQQCCLATSWGTWRFLCLGPKHSETNVDMFQWPWEGVCCLCAALLTPTWPLTSRWDGSCGVEGEVPILARLDNVRAVLLWLI